jgi:hypothetical protein
MSVDRLILDYKIPERQEDQIKNVYSQSDTRL